MALEHLTEFEGSLIPAPRMAEAMEVAYVTFLNALAAGRFPPEQERVGNTMVWSKDWAIANYDELFCKFSRKGQEKHKQRAARAKKAEELMKDFEAGLLKYVQQ